MNLKDRWLKDKITINVVKKRSGNEKSPKQGKGKP